MGADVIDHRQQVAADHNRGTCCRPDAYRVKQRANRRRIETGQRFIQQNHRGVIEIGTADGQFLSHATRQGRDACFVLVQQFKLPQQTDRFFVVISNPIKPPDEVEVFTDTQIVKQWGIVGNVGQTFFQGLQIAAEATTGDA